MESRYRPVQGPNDEAAVRDVLVQCFNFPPDQWPVWAEAVGCANLRMVERDQRVAAAGALLPMGQWFGGRSVPMGAVAAVGVPPEARGSGAARGLMRGILAELRERGVPLSALYATTQRLYRSVGYEPAGLRVRYRVLARALERLRPELPVRPSRPPDVATLADLHRRRAATANGHLDRSSAIWWRLLHQPGRPVYAYLFGDPPEGFVLYRHREAGSAHDLEVCDHALLTPRAARTFWAFLAAHGSTARRLEWPGPAPDPLTALLPEEDHEVLCAEAWMLRIVDVAGALEGRGYPSGAAGRVAFEVRDETFPEAGGAFTLEVDGGTGRVRRAADGPVLRLGIRALAPLYSGYLTPGALRDLGWLEGEEAAIAAASRLFAGPPPWMTESF